MPHDVGIEIPWQPVKWQRLISRLPSRFRGDQDRSTGQNR